MVEYYNIMVTTIKNLKEGTFFTLKDYGENDAPESAVWVRAHYDRASKTYCVFKFADVSHESFMKGNRVVFTDIFF